MKNLFSGVIVATMVVLRAAAIDMSLYSPTNDVDAEFQTFLKECVLPRDMLSSSFPSYDIYLQTPFPPGNKGGK